MSSTVAGWIDSLELGEGFAYVAGWLRLPLGAFAAGSVALRLATENGAFEQPIRRTRKRADLATAPGEPEAQGFQILLPARAAGSEIRLAILQDGEAVPTGPELILPRPFRPRGHLGQPNRHGIGGWVFDGPAARPSLLVDGRFEFPLLLDQHRPDLRFEDGRDPPLWGFQVTLEALGTAMRDAWPAASLLDGAPHGVTLLASGVELGHEVLHLPRFMEGALELARPGEARGWAAEIDPGRELPAVELVLDGTRWASLPAIEARRDLIAAGVGTRLIGGAFRARLPWLNPGDRPTLAVSLRPAHGLAALKGEAALEALPPWRPDHGTLRDTLPVSGVPPVAIVIAIHNAADDLARCLDSVIRHTTGAARLILIDDASTDPAVAGVLAQHAEQERIELHRNEQNLGYTATVNRGLALAGRDDVVLLNSDTVVGPRWLDGLRLAAYSRPNIGTVTPLSNNAGAFSAPEFDRDNMLPDWFAPDDMARLARQASLALWPAVPTGNGFCMYVRRACLDAVGAFDTEAFPRGYGEENDFCMRAGHAGFDNLVDDRTLVWHRRSASFGDSRKEHIAAGRQVLAARYPEYRALVAVFREDEAFLAIRWRLRRALEAAQAALTRPRPRVLFVIATESGGTPQTNRDLMAALADRYEPWVLRSDGAGLILTRFGEEAPAEHHRLGRALEPGTHRSGEYDRRVADILLRHGFELVHVRHLAWHGLGLTATARALGIPVVFSFHDFYAVCPTIKLLDGEGRHCGGRCSAGSGECAPELWPASQMPSLRERFVHRWRVMMENALRACDAFVTTAPSARATLLETFPFLAERDFRLIPHGRSFARLATLATEPSPDEPLRVLVPGNISAAKGGATIAAIAALDTEREIEFHVLGAVDDTLAEPRPGIVLHGRYERDAFAERAREIHPHIAAILSVWPETYCHTLTECWAAGLPVLGSALGAVGERIALHGGGWLADAAADPAQLLAFLRHLKRDIVEVRARRDEVLDWQRSVGRHYDANAMAAAYDVLYREVLERRRAFAAARPAARPPVVLVPERRAPGAASRIGLPVANALGRGVVYRSVLASCPFGGAAGGGDALLVGCGAVPAHDLPDLLARAAAARLPAVIEVSEAAARDALDHPNGETAALLARGVLLAATPRAARLLEAAGRRCATLPAALDPVEWHAALPALGEEAGAAAMLAFGDDPALDPLRAPLAHLAALEVAPLSLAGAPAGPDLPSPRGLRALVPYGALAILPGAAAPGGSAPPGLMEQRALAAAAAGLVVLRRAGEEEPFGETARGEILLPAHPLAWTRMIAELAVDPARRSRLARRAMRHARAQVAHDLRAAALDRIITAHLASRAAAEEPAPAAIERHDMPA